MNLKTHLPCLALQLGHKRWLQADVDEGLLARSFVLVVVLLKAEETKGVLWEANFSREQVNASLSNIRFIQLVFYVCGVLESFVFSLLFYFL